MNRAALFDQASNRTVTEEDRSTILSVCMMWSVSFQFRCYTDDGN